MQNLIKQKSTRNISLLLMPVKKTGLCHAIFEISVLKAEPTAQTAISLGEVSVFALRFPLLQHYSLFKGFFLSLLKKNFHWKRMSPTPKRSKQSSLSDFVSKASFERTDAEITKFVLTFGVSFNVIRNPYFQNTFSSWNASCRVPSEYKVSGPLLDRENQDINKWKEQKLSFGLLFVQNRGDGWMNKCRVGCMNMECITQHCGPFSTPHHRSQCQTSSSCSKMVGGKFIWNFWAAVYRISHS